MSARPTYLVAVADGSIYMGYSPTNLTLCTGGDGVLEDTPIMGMQDAPGSPNDTGDRGFHRHVYFCDGVSYYRLDAHTGGVDTFTAYNGVDAVSGNTLAGSLPSDDDDNVGTLMAFYRDRLVIAGVKDEPHTWFMSASGDVRNWDYSYTTPTSAIAGTSAAGPGDTPDRITCLIAASDDLLIFGGHQSITVLRGDPAADGQLDNISRQVGIVGPDAWAFDPANSLYFIGNDGLYRLNANASGLDKLSAGRLDKVFTDLDLTVYRPILAWDRKRQGLFILFADDTGTNPPIHYFWDSRTDGFWPLQLPASNGPVSAYTFDTDADGDRTLLLGGYDGFIRHIRDNRLDDNDGVTEEGFSEEVEIESYVDLGPIIPAGPSERATITNLVVTMGDTSDPVAVQLFADRTAEAVSKTTQPRLQGTTTPGRSKAWRQRVSDFCFRVRLYQKQLGKTWVFDNAWFDAILNGPVINRSRKR